MTLYWQYNKFRSFRCSHPLSSVEKCECALYPCRKTANGERRKKSAFIRQSVNDFLVIWTHETQIGGAIFLGVVVAARWFVSLIATTHLKAEKFDEFLGRNALRKMERAMWYECIWSEANLRKIPNWIATREDVTVENEFSSVHCCFILMFFTSFQLMFSFHKYSFSFSTVPMNSADALLFPAFHKIYC